MKAKRKKLRFKFDKLQAKENPKNKSISSNTYLESVSENTQNKQEALNNIFLRVIAIQNVLNFYWGFFLNILLPKQI